jgi:hypothetical protein
MTKLEETRLKRVINYLRHQHDHSNKDASRLAQFYIKIYDMKEFNPQSPTEQEIFQLCDLMYGTPLNRVLKE